MPRADVLSRFVIEGSAVRGEIVHLHEAWQTIQERHRYPEPVRSILGECIAAAALLAATIKFQGKLTLQASGNGALRMLVVEASSQRTLRALARFDESLPPQADLGTLLGEVRLAITVDPGEGGERYQGLVDARGRSLADALEGYFHRSEQLPTRLWLGANAEHAAGLLLQRMPGRAGMDPEEENETWERSVILSETIKAEELLELDAEGILRRLYAEEQVRLFKPEPWRFQCNCSQERVRATLHALGKDELTAILSEDGEVSVDCEFCSSKYDYDAVDLAELIADQPSPSSPSWEM